MGANRRQISSVVGHRKQQQRPDAELALLLHLVDQLLLADQPSETVADESNIVVPPKTILDQRLTRAGECLDSRRLPAERQAEERRRIAEIVDVGVDLGITR